MSGILHASTLLLALEVETVYSCAPTGVPELATHSFKITCKCSESAKEKRIALYNFFMFISDNKFLQQNTKTYSHPFETWAVYWIDSESEQFCCCTAKQTRDYGKKQNKKHIHLLNQNVMKPGFGLTIKFQYLTSEDQHYIHKQKQHQLVRMHRLLLWH